MKKILKTILACLVIFQATAVFAQQLNTSQMNNSGQSAEDTKARYILGLVRNNNAAALDKYFHQFPWDIQARIDVYQKADKKASVSIFCVAVDLGLIDVVKTFIKYGYGPADLCDVRTFTKERVMVSKAEVFIHNKVTSSASGGSSSSSSARSWFSGASSSSGSSASAYAHQDTTLSYSQVAYSTVTSVKNYFAYPLDFADGEMFDYLFAQGFRSDNLLNMTALQEAVRLGRQDVVNYILANMPKKDLVPASIISDEEYAKMIKFAQEHPGSFAYNALVNGTLKTFKTYKTSAQAKNASKELENTLRDMEVNMQIKSPSDTLGYAYLQQQIKAKEAELAEKEAAAAKAKAYQEKINKLRTDDLSKIALEYRFTANKVCEKGTKTRTVYCSLYFVHGKWSSECNLSTYKYENYPRSYTIHCK